MQFVRQKLIHKTKTCVSNAVRKTKTFFSDAVRKTKTYVVPHVVWGIGIRVFGIFVQGCMVGRLGIFAM